MRSLTSPRWVCCRSKCLYVVRIDCMKGSFGPSCRANKVRPLSKQDWCEAHTISVSKAIVTKQRLLHLGAGQAAPGVQACSQSSHSVHWSSVGRLAVARLFSWTSSCSARLVAAHLALCEGRSPKGIVPPAHKELGRDGHLAVKGRNFLHR